MVSYLPEGISQVKKQMARLRSRMLLPPHGFFWLEGDIKLNGGSFVDTVKLMARHRKSNKLPPGDPEFELENFTCQRWPNGCDFASTERRQEQAHQNLANQASDFLGIYGRWAAIGFETVDQVEANQRGDLCWKCPANQKVTSEEKESGCCGKNKIITKIEAVSRRMANALTWPVIRNKVTPADNELYTCNVCGCPNKVSVWVPQEVFEYDQETTWKFLEANKKCWKVNK